MIRLLTDEERPQAEALHKASESCGALPSGRALVGAVTEDGEVVALLGVELMTFLGPLVVKKEWRGKQLPFQLVEHVRERAPKGSRVIVYTGNPHVKRLAEEFGMEELPGAVYMTEVR